jgi:hypothetical protein
VEIEMLTKLTPQKVQSSSGYIVQVADRFFVEYIENEKKAKVEVDFAPVVGIYESSLSTWEDGSPLSKKKEKIILNRIAEALKFMGSKVEFC